MTRVLLLRHGEWGWTAKGGWKGRPAPPLSELGKRQARVAADGLVGVQGVVASPLLRASQTAEVIAGAHGCGPPALDAGFAERAVGEWSGLTRAEIEDRWPGWILDGRRPQGWEPDHDVLDRASEALQRVVHAHAGRDVVVVTHGGVVMSFERHLGAERAPLPNLAGRWLHANVDRLEL